VRIGAERGRRTLRIVDIAATDADAREDDLTGRAERHRPQELVGDVDDHVAYRRPQRDPAGRRRGQYLVVGVVTGLGQSVGVDQGDPRAAGEPSLHQLAFERLPGGRDKPQPAQWTRPFLEVGEDDFQV
jgi:hypothetical protein